MNGRKTYSGFNENTVNNLLLDAGAVYVNYDIEQPHASQKDKLLGATSGGNTFEAVPEYRQIEVDGVKGKAKGLSILESWEVNLQTNMLEFREETYKYALAAIESAEQTIDGNEYTEIKARNYVLDEDYLDNVTFIGTVSGSASPVIIQVYNALNMEGLSINNVDGSDIVAQLKFEGHYDAGNLDNPPFAIYYPNSKAKEE